MLLIGVAAAASAHADHHAPTLAGPQEDVGALAGDSVAADMAALQREVARLRDLVEGPDATTPLGGSLGPDEYAPSELAADVEDLVAWRKAMEKAEAKAAAKAALGPTVQFKTRFFWDAHTYDQNQQSVNQVGNAQNATNLRWAWLEMGGKVVENTSYRLWFDLAGQVSLLDVYLDFAELPGVQNVRVGHFFEPFGMEQLTPNKYLTFMERSSAFTFGRNTGVMAHSDDGDANWTYGLGVFVAEQGSKPPRFQDDNDATAITGRLTWTPWFDEATGAGVFHTGVDYSWRNLADGSARFRNRPESYMAPFVVDTGDILADDYHQFGLEAAYAYGPWHVQGEYHGVSISPTGGGDEYLDGWYVETSYFLTGEHRGYNRRSGSFSNKIVPLENFFLVNTGPCSTCAGWGAWELAYRYSHTDLSDTLIQGGETGLHNLGLNWYLSPYTRMMLNYIHSDTDTVAASDGELNVFQMRMQFNL